MLKDLRTFHEKRRYIFGQIIIINEESILEIGQKCHPDCQVDGGVKWLILLKRKNGEKQAKNGFLIIWHRMSQAANIYEKENGENWPSKNRFCIISQNGKVCWKKTVQAKECSEEYHRMANVVEFQWKEKGEKLSKQKQVLENFTNWSENKRSCFSRGNSTEWKDTRRMQQGYSKGLKDLASLSLIWLNVVYIIVTICDNLWQYI